MNQHFELADVTVDRAERRIHDDRRDEAHLRDIDWSAP